MASSSKLSTKEVLCDNLAPHIFKTFDPSEDYESFQRHIILPIIHDSHEHQYIYYTNKPALPLPVAFTPSHHSIKSVYWLILDTDVNSTNRTPFPHYIDYPPHQSASIPIAQRITA